MFRDSSRALNVLKRNPRLIMWCASSARVCLVNTFLLKISNSVLISNEVESHKSWNESESCGRQGKQNNNRIVLQMICPTKYSFRLMGQFRFLKNHFSFSRQNSSQIFVQVFRKEIKVESHVSRKLLVFLHFSSSENAGDKINEDTRHVSCFSMTSEAV